MEPLVPLFWISGDVCLGFPLAPMLHRLHAMDSSDLTPGATPADLLVMKKS